MGLTQYLMHTGAAHEVTPACEARHCHSCATDGPARFAVVCGECFHGWRFRWLLSLADARLNWQLGRRVEMWNGTLTTWTPLRERIRVRRASRIWVCPCCTHDL